VEAAASNDAPEKATEAARETTDRAFAEPCGSPDGMFARNCAK